MLLALVTAIAALSWYGQTKKGRHKFDQIRLHFPLFGKIYRLTLSARFSRIQGTLLAGGVTLHASLILVNRIIDNAVVSKSIGEISTAIGLLIFSILSPMYRIFEMI